MLIRITGTITGISNTLLVEKESESGIFLSRSFTKEVIVDKVYKKFKNKTNRR